MYKNSLDFQVLILTVSVFLSNGRKYDYGRQNLIWF